MNRNDQEFIAQKIRTQYTQKQSSDIDALRKLDSKVKRPANIFAYVFGSIAAIIMGCGMSIVMTDIGAIIGVTENAMLIGVITGVVGMALALINYPIYKGILASRKKKYAPRIIELSDKITNK